VEEFAAYVVKTQTDNVGIAFPATVQGGAYGFGKVKKENLQKASNRDKYQPVDRGLQANRLEIKWGVE